MPLPPPPPLPPHSPPASPPSRTLLPLPRRLLNEFGAPVFVVALLLLGLFVAKSSPPGPAPSLGRRGGEAATTATATAPTAPPSSPLLLRVLPGAEPSLPAAATSLNEPYYQAGLRPLVLSLGPQHPIRASRPPHALFADVRVPASWLLDEGSSNGGLAALPAAASDESLRSRGGKIPEDAAAYELFEEEKEEDEDDDGPANPGRPRRQRLLTCFDAAKRLFPEPFHPSMLVRNRAVPTSWAAEAPPAAPERGARRQARRRWRQRPHPHPTKLSPSLWRWEDDDKPITRATLDAIPVFLGGEHCPLCYDVVRYRLRSGRLYRRSLDCRTPLRGNASSPLLPPGETRCGKEWMRGHVLEEIMLAAAFLYALPDGEVAVHRGDGAARGLPVLQANIARDHSRAGFAFPYPEHWVQGPPSAAQASAWASCTRARYGGLAAVRGERPSTAAAAGTAAAAHPAPLLSSSCAQSPVIPRAVWRGSTTDPSRGAWLHQVMATRRAQLHALSLVHRDVLDARLVEVAQMDEPGVYRMAQDKAADELLFGMPTTEEGRKAERNAAAERLADCSGGGGGGAREGPAMDDENDDPGLPRPPLFLAMEDFNRYSAVLDVDGNGWSARLYALMLGSSARPVLKQSTALAAYYEHLFAPGGRHMAHFRGDLRDVDDVARRFARLAVAGEAEEREGGGGGSAGRKEERGEEDTEEEQLPSTPTEADRMAREAAALASVTLNKWAMIESAAAALEAALERFSEGEEGAGEDEEQEGVWERVPFSACCMYGGLPAELLAAMAEAD